MAAGLSISYSIVIHSFRPKKYFKHEISNKILASDCRRTEVRLSLLMHRLDVSGNAMLELVESPQIMERNCSSAKKKWIHF